MTCDMWPPCQAATCLQHAASVCLENLPDLKTIFIAPETHSPIIPYSMQTWLTLFQDKPWLFEYLLLQKQRKQANSLQRRVRWMQHDHRVVPCHSWLWKLNPRNQTWAGSLAHQHSDHWGTRKKAIKMPRWETINPKLTWIVYNIKENVIFSCFYKSYRS